jgi:chorismate synthase
MNLLQRLRFLTAGESHGPMLSGILDGMPAGVVVDPDEVARQLARRRLGHGRSPRQKLERDVVEVTGGIRFCKTTGAPIALHLKNAEAERWKEKLSVWGNGDGVDKDEVPRPGHADLAGLIKYDLDDVRDILERASARETAMRVALSTIPRAMLSACGISVGSDVIGVGGVGDVSDVDSISVDDVDDVDEANARADVDPMRCLDPVRSAKMVARVDEARKTGTTLGGHFVVRASGLPVGLGSHAQYDRRLGARLCMAVSSIQAIKAVGVGVGARLGDVDGHHAHDDLHVGADGVGRHSNRAGGVEGGMSTGEPIRLLASMKPFSTVPGGLPSLNLGSGQAERGLVERSDVCAVPAAAVVAEAMVVFVLADALLSDLGGDSLAELQEHLAWRRNRSQARLGRRPPSSLTSP